MARCSHGLQELIITIGDRYRLNRKIAAGGFGAVYLGMCPYHHHSLAGSPADL